MHHWWTLRFSILSCSMSQVQGLTLIQSICCAYDLLFKPAITVPCISILFKIVCFVKTAVTNLTILQAKIVRIVAKLLQANTHWVTTALTLTLSVSNWQNPNSAKSPYVYIIISDQTLPYMYSCFSMIRTALRLLGNKGKVARYLYSCCRMFRTTLRLLGNKGKVARYLYSCCRMFRITLRLLRNKGKVAKYLYSCFRPWTWLMLQIKIRRI